MGAPRGTRPGARLGALLLVIVVLGGCLEACLAQSLMGPGSVSPYTGGGGGQRRVGYVREPAEGFFVGGSSIKDMNGVYKKVEQVPLGLRDVVHMAYRKWPADQQDTFSGWHLCLVKAPEPGTVPWETVGGKKSEWIFIDPSRRERFGHEGDTVIPGAGTNWKHLHREKGEGAEGQVAAPDDEDELPWQVIFIGSAQMVEELRQGELQKHRAVHYAIGNGYSCKDRQQGCDHEEPPQGLYELPDVSELLEAGKYSEASEVFGMALVDGGADGGWREAELRRGKGMCLRKAREFPKAIDEIAQALRVRPSYKHALFELGLSMLDAGRPAGAISVLEKLLNLDRRWPRIAYWIQLAHANQKRSQDKLEAMPVGHTPSGVPMRKPGELPRTPEQAQNDHLVTEAIRRGGFVERAGVIHGIDHYVLLGVSVDHTEEELKRAYKTASRKAHPDKNGGSNDAFQAVAAAYETLSEPDARALYDEGSDIKRDLREDGSEGPSWGEQVLRAYFPEDYPYEPFGDPYERKRQVAEERRQTIPPAPNGEGIPPGGYLQSCKGCAIVHGQASTDEWLRCTHCLTGQGSRFDESSIKLGSCQEDEWITNHFGRLMCETAPGGGSIDTLPETDKTEL